METLLGGVQRPGTTASRFATKASVPSLMERLARATAVGALASDLPNGLVCGSEKFFAVGEDAVD
jgi:hypothetical protein